MNIEIGKTYMFDYPEVFVLFPEYTAHAGQQVTVIRPCIDGKEYDREDGELMFKVRAPDGWVGDAWESELRKENEPRKYIVDGIPGLGAVVIS